MKSKVKITTKKLIAVLLTLLIISSVLPSFTVSTSAAGITATTPNKDGNGVYQIGTAAELYWFADKVNNDNANYGSAKAVLTADIVVNKNVLNSKGELNSGTFTDWTPIGNRSNQYTGKFDGQGHTISGLYFNNTSTDFVGLFGCLGTDGEIKNVGVIDSYFNDYGYVGGVCGGNFGGTITGCYNTGTVSGDYYVGGVCGRSYGTITGCYNTGTVSGRDMVGGVCGWNGTTSGTMTGCYNIGTVSGKGNYVGGVCGWNGTTSGTMTGCYNIGTVSGKGNYVGGVCGYNRSEITACYTNNGGVCGYNYGGTISSDCAEYNGNEFKDNTVCKLLNTALKNANSDVRFYQGANYPELISNVPKLVDGVYQISNKQELYAFAQLVNSGAEPSANAVLTADITVNNNLLSSLVFDGNKNVTNGDSFERWTPIGYYDSSTDEYVLYSGTFDGQGHTISGLYFNDTNAIRVGLFGYLGSGGEIKNTGVIDSYFNGGYYVGGVCGDNNSSTITGCYNTGTVSGTSNIGGVCGKNTGGTTIGCYNTGTVSGDYEVGGVCGNNYKGTITGCYNTETVSGKSNVGGVCGANDGGTITGCYTYTNKGGVCGNNFGDGKIDDCDEYTYNKNGDEFTDTTVCGLLNAALKNYGSDVRFYQGVKLPEFIHAPQLVDGVYQISCAAELYWFAQLVNSGTTNANAVLTADIIVNKDVLNDSGELNSGTFTDWTPIGYYNSSSSGYVYYSGTFDGQGHTISGLYFNDTSAFCVGLFGCLGSGGEIKNVGVIDSYFRGRYRVGGVCGYNLSNGTITDCYNTGRVSGSGSSVGGVCGYNLRNGTITGCYNTGRVSGNDEVGGVCGYNQEGTITGCYNTGTVSGSDYVGGVCGYNLSNGTITGCYNTGTVSGSYVGGVCGYNLSNGTITGCYNIGTVSGTINVGGVCGYNRGTNTSTSIITGCYTNNKDICGYNDGGTISSDCAVKSDPEFKDTTVCKLLNTALKNANSDVRYYQGANYPELSIIPNLPDIVDGVYQISNKLELYAFAQLVNSGAKPSANAVLTADITVNDFKKTPLKFDDKGNVTNGDSFESWKTIGYYDSLTDDYVLYSGTFDGQGHTISGLYFNDTNAIYVGLFGFFGSDDEIKCEIKNVGVIDSYFKGNVGVGGVCGYNYQGTITGCYNTGTVSSSGGYVGGVCGWNNGTITGCYNTGTVSSSGDYVGGICSYNDGGIITGCYNTGTVSGSSSVGGVYGVNDKGTITDCYTNRSGDTYYKSDEEFKNGTVCGLLNTALKNASSNVLFCQRIGTDDSPLLTYQFESIDEHTYEVYTVDVDNNTFNATCLCGKKRKTMNLTLTTQKTVVVNGEANTLTATLFNLDNEVVTYKWYQNGVEIEGATSSTYNMPTNLSAGTYTYRVDVTMSGVGTISSQTVDVLVDIIQTYTVTIPETVTLGGTATIKAENVVLEEDKQLEVTITGTSGDNNAFAIKSADGEVLEYTVTKADGTKVSLNDKVLTVNPDNTNPDSTTLTFNTPGKAKFSGEYKGTVTFNVSIN
ncbi:MAG: GLUG motif-containing protein [Acutalibacteraceae bacterium]